MWISGSVSRQKQKQLRSPVGGCVWSVGGTARRPYGWSAGNKGRRGNGGFCGNCRTLAFTLSEMGNYWRISSRRMAQSDLPFFFLNVVGY